jgi:hypothetical protein
MPIRAAQYLRMSTEHQQYSLANQSAKTSCPHTNRTPSSVDSQKSTSSLTDRVSAAPNVVIHNTPRLDVSYLII